MRIPSWVSRPLAAASARCTDRRLGVGSTYRTAGPTDDAAAEDLVPFAVFERIESPGSSVDEPRDQMVLLTEGEIDLATAPLLERALLAAVEGHSRVCCDLTGVTFFSAAGLTALVTAHRRAADTGCHFSVRRARGITQRILHLSGIGGLLDTTPCAPLLPRPTRGLRRRLADGRAREQPMPQEDLGGSDRGWTAL